MQELRELLIEIAQRLIDEVNVGILDDVNDKMELIRRYLYLAADISVKNDMKLPDIE